MAGNVKSLRRKTPSPSEPPDYWARACKSLAARDKVMAHLIRRYRGSYLHGNGDAFTTLCRAVVGQQISLQAADAIWEKLSAKCAPLEPRTLCRKRSSTLLACGVSQQKAACLKEISRFFMRQNITAQYWQSLGHAEVFEALTAIKGVGKWTFEMFAIFYLRHPDIFPAGDLGLIKAIERAYGKNRKLETIAAKWTPWRTVATWYLWRSIDPEPVVY